MKKTSKIYAAFIISTIFLLFQAHAALATAPAGYTLTFSDEFNGPTLDKTKWRNRWGPAEDHFIFSNGILSIKGDYQCPSCGSGNISGAIDTLDIFSQKYGWFETRFKSRIGSGMHSAFWLRPADGYDTLTGYDYLVSNGGTRQSSSESFEIDIFEQLGRSPHNNLLSAHYGTSYDVNHLAQAKDYNNPNINFTTEFHVLALEWLPDKLIWYLDGTEVFRSDKEPQVPFFMIVSLYPNSSSWTGPLDPNQIYPVYFDLDYVRVYQKSGTTPTPSPTCTSFTYSAWSACQSNNTQTRTITSSSPSGCTGGNPITSQSCTSGGCANLNFLSGSVSPSLVSPGGAYTMKCDYGAQVNSIGTVPGSGSCTYASFSGTTANFNCTAGATSGTFTNKCSVLSGTSANTCARQDSINNITLSETPPPADTVAPAAPSGLSVQ